MFVVRAMPRCGTHMVRTAINQLHGVTCHNEIFNPEITPHESQEQLGPAGVIEKYVGTGPSVGFVAHGWTWHDKFKGWKLYFDMWKHIVKIQPKMIILEREDLVRRAASVKVAEQTKRWHIWASQEEAASLPTVRMTPEEFIWSIESAERAFIFGRKKFPMAMRVSYEELTTHFQDYLHEMQYMFGIGSPIQVKPLTTKMDTRPVREIVENYDEVRDALRGTELEKYFELSEGRDESLYSVPTA